METVTLIGKVKNAPDLCQALQLLSIKLPNFLESDRLSEDEIKCSACDGTGVQIAKQPSEPGKRTIARCKVCDGKGRLKKSTD